MCSCGVLVRCVGVRSEPSLTLACVCCFVCLMLSPRGSIFRRAGTSGWKTFPRPSCRMMRVAAEARQLVCRATLRWMAARCPQHLPSRRHANMGTQLKHGSVATQHACTWCAAAHRCTLAHIALVVVVMSEPRAKEEIAATVKERNKKLKEPPHTPSKVRHCTARMLTRRAGQRSGWVLTSACSLCCVDRPRVSLPHRTSSCRRRLCCRSRW